MILRRTNVTLDGMPPGVDVVVPSGKRLSIPEELKDYRKWAAMYAKKHFKSLAGDFEDYCNALPDPELRFLVKALPDAENENQVVIEQITYDVFKPDSDIWKNVFRREFTYVRRFLTVGCNRRNGEVEAWNSKDRNRTFYIILVMMAAEAFRKLRTGDGRSAA